MADQQYIASTGTIVPDTSSLLSGVQSEFKAVFGDDLVVTPDTPQGVLITAETLARNDVLANNAQLANQINPNLAGGVYLDALLALTGMQRTAARRSTVTATLTGEADTVIPAGSQAKTAAGDIFQTISTVVIGAGGTVSAQFQSAEYGAIPCASGALTMIVSGILGWETVTNPSAAIPGAAEQSDKSARALRRNTLAFQGLALPEAITSALYAVEGVKSLTFRENTGDTTATIDGVSMVAHSIFVCVDGGTDADVAAAILENKSSGSNWNGSTTVSVVEPVSGQTYNVKFQRPAVISIAMQVTIKRGTATAVKAAIMDYVQGNLDGEDGFIVGASVSPFEIASAINRANPSIYVQKVEVSLASSISWSTSEIAIAINQIASTTESLITVIVA